MRRQFNLPEGDEAYLASLNLPCETIIENNQRWVVIHDFPLPKGYDQIKASMAVKIESCYPDVQLDMVYFFPHLSRSDQKSIGALSSFNLDGKNWQRWSRHRTSKNPWRPGIDDLASHILLIQYWLEREFRKA
ncbi:MAG: hypothetical protein DWB56_14100 [Candidatus Jettenia sp.]|uniref:Uncharacterized protein n=1 Tax=Candidatus Jettenia caeni TaxID=247490 RepID=I3IHE3_9BACT|nr:E2/UBC family protein [Candidatus Jettenia sp. AMX1]MBC6930065.1 hypothetical protein [Candidatus Jettenia sp.]NUN23905.1 hypothetical protein [Candidatus Jettenia caeni]KAA0248072.1 MAG: hypothetical protein EDM77_13550 [Candidatus Jettenia sp. AMX1]MCE7881539.1 hypothetical protein [Candidatus Jettenia sp. AMX1]MCQ3928156.1 hypothetical protein [Candidatus Jettenia sp.]